MYIVLSKNKNYRYGAFPFNEDGLENAKNFVKEMGVLRSEELYIVEK